MSSSSKTLLEVKVKVNSGSIGSRNFTFTRADGKITKTGPCMSDQGAPLICSHLETKEWITVGVTIQVAFMCSSAGFRKAVATSLLPDNAVHNFYDGLQTTKYIPT